VVRVAPNVNALPKLHPPPTRLNVIAPFITTPLVVIVLLDKELNVIPPLLFQIVPAISVMEPDTVSEGVVPVANVTVPAETVISRQARAPVIVTVYVAAWSKKTESVAVGADAPEAPPDVADQLVVVVVHVPVPPTQYLSAIYYS
jgi:hypothetical protein